jgi:hypothetical protein
VGAKFLESARCGRLTSGTNQIETLLPLIVSYSATRLMGSGNEDPDRVRAPHVTKFVVALSGSIPSKSSNSTLVPLV